ncbi:conserved hypothetical protein [Candidatus Roizmanbacteria bacterium]|nr:conserved hypothetical protein [Candidatus Roizmanbacteria bacterium]
MKNINICIFCKRTADTREHIPAKQFFKGVSDKNLITVPSCDSCNKGFQKDEDFFRQFWVSMLMDRSKVAKQLMDGEITRSIKRTPALGYQMFSQMQLIDAYTKSGIYVGKKTMYCISDIDKKRISSVVTKIIKGLFFNEFKQILQEDWEIKIIWITPQTEKNLKLVELAKTLKWKVIKEDTFAYGVNYVPNTFQSIWIIDFFRTPLFYILALEKQETKEIKKSYFK